MNFLVNSTPKSASSYTVNLISKVFSLKKVELGYHNRHFILDENKVRPIACSGVDSISHVHLRGYSFHKQMINDYDLHGVLLIRPLVESVVSLADWIKHQNSKIFDESLFFSEKFKTPKLSEEERFDAVIAYCMPWYLSFIKEWDEFVSEKFIRIDYNMVTSNPYGLIDIFSEKFSIHSALSSRELVDIFSAKKNFNSGDAGRWERLLTYDQVARIEEMAKFYEIDDLVFNTDSWVRGW